MVTMGTIKRLALVCGILVCIILVVYKSSSQNIMFDYKTSHGFFRESAIESKNEAESNDVIQFTLPKISKDLPYYDDHADDLIIIYNRVPKTGSTSFMNVVYGLHAKNHFSAAFVNVSSRSHRWQFLDQFRFAQNITQWKSRIPGIYHGHFPFLNFLQMGFKQPIYINIVRDPLERLVSYYYFIRYGDTYLPNKIRSKQGDDTTFDDCVKRKLEECHPNRLWLQIPYFCGSDPDCWKPGSRAALHRAQRNVINYYFLVGTTDTLQPFIETLERTLPRIFSGASERFGSGVHIRKTKVKKPLLSETISYFKQSKVWKLEQEFYKFIQNRFRNVFEDTKSVDTRLSYVKVKP